MVTWYVVLELLEALTFRMTPIRLIAVIKIETDIQNRSDVSHS